MPKTSIKRVSKSTAIKEKRKDGKKGKASVRVKDKINKTPLPALLYPGEKNKDELSKSQRKYVNGVKGNPIQSTKDVNYLEVDIVATFNSLLKSANALGFFVELHCGRKHDGAENICKGKIMTRLHKDGEVFRIEPYCEECKTRWRLAKDKTFFKGK